MFQSLKSRTYENLQALFSGKVNTQQTFSTLAMPPEKLKLESTFKPLQDQGKLSLYTDSFGRKLGMVKTDGFG